MHWSLEEAFGARMGKWVEKMGIPLRDCKTFAKGFLDYYECVGQDPWADPSSPSPKFQIYLQQEYLEVDKDKAVRVCCAAGRAAVDREKAIRSPDSHRFRPLLHYIYDELYKDDERI